jgi:RNA 3'-terminal phosphate cyclase (ATP)/RNA 3'-terminal phosphate cyclase (GTP)
MGHLVEIDGSLLEGGGQILRTATSLSAITGKPLHVYNIRAKREKPGLKTQHLQGIRAIASLCGGKLEGDALGSREIFFRPGPIESRPIDVSIPTAGSIGLIFQSLKLPAAMGDKGIEITVSGGATFGKFAPPVPYTRNVLLPLLKKMGYDARIDIRRHGFYPVGGARVSMKFSPFSKLKPIMLKRRGEVKNVEGISIASKHLMESRVADRQAESARELLSEGGYEARIKAEYVDSACPGSGIVLWARSSEGCVLGADGLGERGKPSEKVAEDAAIEMLIALDSDATVDSHASDQLLPMMALAKGKSTIVAPKLTMHAKTNMWTVQRFMNVGFETRETENGAEITCAPAP